MVRFLKFCLGTIAATFWWRNSVIFTATFLRRRFVMLAIIVSHSSFGKKIVLSFQTTWLFSYLIILFPVNTVVITVSCFTDFLLHCYYQFHCCIVRLTSDIHILFCKKTAILLWFVFVLFKSSWYNIHNFAPFVFCFSTSCLKIKKYFGALAVKIIYYEHLASVVSIVFFVFFFSFF